MPKQDQRYTIISVCRVKRTQVPKQHGKWKHDVMQEGKDYAYYFHVAGNFFFVHTHMFDSLKK